MYQKTFGKSEKGLGHFANPKIGSISVTCALTKLISQETPGLHRIALMRYSWQNGESWEPVSLQHGVIVMSKIVFALTLVVILSLSYLALENPTAVQLKLFQKGPTEVPLYMVIFGAFVLGALFVYLLFLLQGVRGALVGRREKRTKKRDERTDAYRQEARKASRLGDLDTSRTLLEKATQMSPDTLELYLDLADVFLEEKKYAEASDRYHHVFSRDPQNMRAILGIAVCSEGTENYSEAEYYYARVLEMEKPNSLALEGLLRTQRGQHKWQEAMETLRRLKRAGLVSTEEFDDSLALLWYQQGVMEKEAGNLKASISSLEKSLKGRSEFLPTLLSLGDVYIRDGSPERALKIWESDLAERFRVPVAKALENYMIEHEGERALIQFYKKISSRSELARLFLARLYLRLDRIEDAEKEIREIPDMEASPRALLVLAEIEKRRLNEALANRHYSLAFELLHHQLHQYRCSACSTPHDKWTPQCPACGAWDTLDTDQVLL